MFLLDGFFYHRNSDVAGMFDTTKATHKHDARFRENVMLFSIPTHEKSDVISSEYRVLEHRLHLGNVVLQFFREADVAFNHTEQGSIYQ